MELYERLSHLGWSVTEVEHDPTQHPCEVVEQLASADVLLTSYGFQARIAPYVLGRLLRIEQHLCSMSKVRSRCLL